MSQPYSVKVRITSQGGAVVTNLSIAQGDDTPGNVVPAYGLADPLEIKQALSSGARSPQSQTDPDEATVNLIAPDSATYAAVAVGDPIAVVVWPAAGFAGTPIRFCGRVAAMTSQGHDLGVKLTLACVDYTADLRTVDVGAGAWPAEDANARMGRIADELGVQHFGRDWTVVTSPQMAARAAGKQDAYTAIVATADSWYVNSFRDENDVVFATPPVTDDLLGAQMYRPRLVQNITGADEAGLMYEPQPFVLRIYTPVTRRVSYAPPARISNLAGVRTVTVAAADSSVATGAPILDAGRVKFAPAFTQAKEQGLPNVTTAHDAAGNSWTVDWRTAIGASTGGPGTYVSALPPLPAIDGPTITQDVDSVLDPSAFLPALVSLYRPPFRPDTRGNWQVGTLEYQAWAEAAAWRRPELGWLLTVARAVAAKLPTNREWATGLVVATTLSIAGGRPTFAIDLAPPSYDFNLARWVQGATLGVASMDSPVLAGVTLAQLAPRDTLADYMIVRGS